jgi:hypothetical protein
MPLFPTTWPSWQKVFFRFIFLLLVSSSVFCWTLLGLFASMAFKTRRYNPAAFYKMLSKPLYWLDRHFFHTGYNPKIHQSFPQDNHYGVIFYLSLLLFALLGTLLWSVLDRNRPQYNRLLFWFRLFIRYTLAIVMFGYGIDKFIPVQMSYPKVDDLLTPLLTGAGEIIGSFLMLNRRSAVLGYLLQLVILINVVAFNIFYNVPVKMFSTQLLVYTVFLLNPFLLRLGQLFFMGKTISVTDPVYTFAMPRKKYGLGAVLICIPFFFFCTNTIEVHRRYVKQQASLRQQKLYEVTTFVATGKLPPLLTDTLLWKRFLLSVSIDSMALNKDRPKWVLN